MRSPRASEMPSPSAEALDDGIIADDGVVLGYTSDRLSDEGLVLGPGARLRTGTVLYAGSMIGPRFQTGHHVVVREENVIGADVCVWSGSFIDYGCVIGDRVKVHVNCYVAQYSDIADDAFLAPGVVFANDLFPGNASSAEVMRGPSVGPRAQIGVNVTVLPYVRIGADALIGAGSIVTKDVPDGMMAYGCPAALIAPVSEIDVDQRLLQRALLGLRPRSEEDGSSPRATTRDRSSER
jgi:acetyltransferase-like isoleucine patch superfamily enzyme